METVLTEAWNTQLSVSRRFIPLGGQDTTRKISGVVDHQISLCLCSTNHHLTFRPPFLGLEYLSYPFSSALNYSPLFTNSFPNGNASLPFATDRLCKTRFHGWPHLPLLRRFHVHYRTRSRNCVGASTNPPTSIGPCVVFLCSRSLGQLIFDQQCVDRPLLLR